MLMKGQIEAEDRKESSEVREEENKSWTGRQEGVNGRLRGKNISSGVQ